MHFTPAGLPFGIPGMGDDIEGTMQQAPHLGRHSICCFFAVNLHLFVNFSFILRSFSEVGNLNY